MSIQIITTDKGHFAECHRTNLFKSPVILCFFKVSFNKLASLAYYIYWQTLYHQHTIKTLHTMSATNTFHETNTPCKTSSFFGRHCLYHIVFFVYVLSCYCVLASHRLPRNIIGVTGYLSGLFGLIFKRILFYTDVWII